MHSHLHSISAEQAFAGLPQSPRCGNDSGCKGSPQYLLTVEADPNPPTRLALNEIAPGRWRWELVEFRLHQRKYAAVLDVFAIYPADVATHPSESQAKDALLREVVEAYPCSPGTLARV